MIKRISIIAGGTAGHVFPALSVALSLAKIQNYKVNIVLDKRAFTKFAYKITTTFKVNTIIVTGLHKKNPFFLIKMCFLLMLSFIQSLFFLIKYKTSMVVSFGGYTSVPVGIAVQFINFFKRIFRCKPIIFVIHEQNAILGKSNKILSKYANKIFLTFKDTKGLVEKSKNKTLVVGLPVRDDFYSFFENNHKISYNHPESQIKILVLGGSLGAQIFASTIPEAFRKLNSETQKKFVVYHQCREEYVDDVKHLWNKTATKVYIKSFFDNIAEIMHDVDVIVTRSGASTVSEITILGKYAIYVPFKKAAANHQYYNALWAVENNSSSIVLEDNFNENSFSKILNKLVLKDYLDNKNQLSFTARNKKNATNIITNEINKLFIN